MLKVVLFSCLDETDSIQQHINDTMIAGGHKFVSWTPVKHTVEGGKPSVDFFIEAKVFSSTFR